MPPFVPVQSLYSSCLGAVFEHFFASLQQSPNSVEHLRNLIQSSLHAGIREHLVQIATIRYRENFHSLLDILRILLDQAIKKLDHSGGDDHAVWLRADQCSDLLSTLEQCEATGLQDLTVKVKLDPRRASDLKTVSAANIAFHRMLRNGLATNLRSLVLRSVCDNEILRLLGHLCPNLRHLDATSSWMVDDDGLRALCFKDPESNIMPPDSFCGDITEWLATIQPSELNPCCRSLHEVRIQDTNTSEIGVAMLLLFMPNLRSLGGFIYYRNVGDAIVSLQQYKEGRLKLNLTDLWDTCLSPEKAIVLAKAAPLLTSLYTRGSWLQSVQEFTNLTSLTVDFDFVDFATALEEYLMVHGGKLRKLVLIDQNHSIDVAVLAENCHCLEELVAKLDGGWTNEGGEILPKLTICKIRMYTTDPLQALLVHAHHLEQVEVMIEDGIYGEADLNDSFITQCLAENPRLEHLRMFLLRSKSYLTALSVQLLINSCPSLRIVGDFHFWLGISERDIKDLIEDIISRNLDLMISYRGILRPYFRAHCHQLDTSACYYTTTKFLSVNSKLNCK